MNVGITAMPTDGIQIDDMGNGFALVSLYKKAVTTTNTDGTESITADMYTIQMRNFTGLAAEIKANFDYYWSKAQAAAAEITKDKEIAELQKLLDDTDYESIKHTEGIITDAQFANLKTAREAWRAAIRTLKAATTSDAIAAVTYSTDIPSCK